MGAGEVSPSPLGCCFVLSLPGWVIAPAHSDVKLPKTIPLANSFLNKVPDFPKNVQWSHALCRPGSGVVQSLARWMFLWDEGILSRRAGEGPRQLPWACWTVGSGSPLVGSGIAETIPARDARLEDRACKVLAAPFPCSCDRADSEIHFIHNFPTFFGREWDKLHFKLQLHLTTPRR